MVSAAATSRLNDTPPIMAVSGRSNCSVGTVFPLSEGAKERDRQRVSICPKEAMFTLEYDFPYSPAVVWDYITKPEYRAIMNVIGKSDGCISQGTTYQCAHGNNQYLNTMLDWSPTEQYTVQFSSMLPKVIWLWTIKLSPTGEGSRATMTFGRPNGPAIYLILDKLGWGLFRKRMARNSFLASFQRFEATLKQELGQSAPESRASVEIAPDQVRDAVAESLRG